MKIVSGGICTWKSRSRDTWVGNPYRKIEPVSRVFETPDKTNALFLPGMRTDISDESRTIPGSFRELSARPGQDRGCSRAPWQGRPELRHRILAVVRPTDDSGLFIDNAISAPRTPRRSSPRSADEIATLLRDGFSDAEITAGKASGPQGQQLNRDQECRTGRRLVGQA